MRTNWDGLSKKAKQRFKIFYRSNKTATQTEMLGNCPERCDYDYYLSCAELCETLFPDLIINTCPCFQYGEKAFKALEKCILAEREMVK